VYLAERQFDIRNSGKKVEINGIMITDYLYSIINHNNFDAFDLVTKNN